MSLMTALSNRFGSFSYEEEDVVHFPDGLLGFPDVHDFVLIQHKENSPFRWLQSLEVPTLAFLVTDPGAFFADYAPEMPLDDVEALNLSVETPRLVYTMVTIPSGHPESMTVNLAGPIVIHAETRVARQLVLDDPRYPIRQSIGSRKKEESKVA